MNYLANLRYKTKLSGEEFGKLIGVSQAFVSGIETGKKRPSIETAKRIIDIAKKHKIELTLDEIYRNVR